MQLIEISAWNDSGGGFLHRLFDGHPQLDVWPFELLLGNDHRFPDRLSPDWFRGRFRWPRLEGLSPDKGYSLFDQISDSELKSVLLDSTHSRHGDYLVKLSLSDWRESVAQSWRRASRHDQASFLDIYVETYFSMMRPGLVNVRPVLGHCPTIILDAEELWHDFPEARIIHVVRSPLAGFFDMSRRHPSLTASDYAKKWLLINGHAALLGAKHSDQVKLVSLDMLIAARSDTMARLCDWLGLAVNETLLTPTWLGRRLNPERMGPFGGVPMVSEGRDLALSDALDAGDAALIRQLTSGTRLLVSELTNGAIDL